MRSLRALTAAVAVLGCSSNDPPVAARDAAASCVFASATAACSTCTSEACCAEIESCDADAQCRPLLACLGRCGPSDDACTAQCRRDHPFGYGAPAAKLLSCSASHCERACSSVCGGYVGPTIECTKCTQSRCCGEASACLSDAHCTALTACERACRSTDAACLGDCERAEPAAVEVARSFGACVQTSCTTSCLPRRWRCLDEDRPKPPIVTRASVAITMQVNNFARKMPWAGVNIRACVASDYKCVAPRTPTVITNAAGLATLNLVPDFQGYLEVTATGAAPTMFFLTRVKVDEQRGMGLLDADTFAALTGAIAEPRADRGHLVVNARDCANLNVAGVSVSIDPLGEAKVAYLNGGFPSSTAKATDDFGAAGFVNVTPDTGIKVRGTVVDFKRDFGETTFFARAGWVSFVFLLANP
jgi:hypothetical protein